MSIESIMKSNLQIVKDFCEDTLECVHCPFYNHIANCCKFAPDPMNWDLTEFDQESDYEEFLDEDDFDWLNDDTNI